VVYCDLYPSRYSPVSYSDAHFPHVLSWDKTTSRNSSSTLALRRYYSHPRATRIKISASGLEGEFPEPLWTAKHRLMRSGRMKPSLLAMSLNATPWWSLRHREHGIVADLHQGRLHNEEAGLVKRGTMSSLKLHRYVNFASAKAYVEFSYYIYHVILYSTMSDALGDFNESNVKDSFRKSAEYIDRSRHL